MHAAEGDSYTACRWQSLDHHVFENLEGPMVIAVDAVDLGGVGGMIATVVAGGIEYSSGADSGPQWKCIAGTQTQGPNGGHSAEPPPQGWMERDFDDSAWPTASTFGINGVGPWGDVNRFSEGNGLISPTSRWIWTQDNNAVDDIYCRLTIPCGGGSSSPSPSPEGPHEFQFPCLELNPPTCQAQRIGADTFTLTGSALLVENQLSLTQTENNQNGMAYIQMDQRVRGGSTNPSGQVTIIYEIYTGDGSGADGQCMNLGNTEVVDNAEENGVTQGLSICFDEYGNHADNDQGVEHGVSIFFNQEVVWENIGECGNREGCIPVSLFEDAQWHTIEVNISPSGASGAAITLDFDGGLYGGFGVVNAWTLPTPTLLSFAARTGGATNNHWVRAVDVAYGGGWEAPPPSPPAPPLPRILAAPAFVLSGDAYVAGEVIHLTDTVNYQHGMANFELEDNHPSDFKIQVAFEMYVGDGTGADGMCASVGSTEPACDTCEEDGEANPQEEDGVAQGVSVCFDEYDSYDWNGGIHDHGVSIYYDGQKIWENVAPCGNDEEESCMPVSLFNDGDWHSVRVTIFSTQLGRAEVRFSFDEGMYTGFADVAAFSLPSPAFLVFAARTGGATNNHWVRSVTTSNPQPADLIHVLPISSLNLVGSAAVEGDVLHLTNNADWQQAAAFSSAIDGLGSSTPFSLRYWMFTGDGTGADGQCANIGANDIAGRNEEDGVAEGVSLCFDEWGSQSVELPDGQLDHGISIFYNGETILENLGECTNRDNCIPVSLFDDGSWHLVTLSIQPVGSATRISFDFDNGMYTAFADVQNFELPSPAYIGFSGRTGGFNNDHWVRSVSYGDPTTVAPSAGAPSPPLPIELGTDQFTLMGDAQLAEDDQGDSIIHLTEVDTGQHGMAYYQLRGYETSEYFSVKFSMYTGDGTGADGLCINLGGLELAQEAQEEDGVAQGLSLCFDEWGNQNEDDGSFDHGISMFWNGDVLWEEIAPCEGGWHPDEYCDPVSLFADGVWHQVQVTLQVSDFNGAAQVVFDFDNGLFGGFEDIMNFVAPNPAYVSFSSRTGGATDNHWVKDVSITRPADSDNADCNQQDITYLSNTYCPIVTPPNTVPADCPALCANMILPWFGRCGSSDVYSMLDSQLQGQLTAFRTMCEQGSSGGGGH